MERLVNAVKIDENTTFSYKPNMKSINFKAGQRYAAYQSATNLEEYQQIFKDNDWNNGNADLKYDASKGFLTFFNGDEQLNNLPVEPIIEATED